jgi:hypothetical protein
MRIGSIIIDFDSLTTEDLTMVINEARRIRKRKGEAESYKTRMRDLLEEAKAEGFDFIDKSSGAVIAPFDFELYDNQ